MSLRIEVYSVHKAWKGLEKYVAPRFAADFDLDSNSDDACMAAACVARGLAAMYAGDLIKVVVRLRGEKLAQWVGLPARHEPAFEELAKYIESNRPYPYCWADYARRAA